MPVVVIEPANIKLPVFEKVALVSAVVPPTSASTKVAAVPLFIVNAPAPLIVELKITLALVVANVVLPVNVTAPLYV